MFISNVKFYVKSTISSTQGVGTTFKISEDFETNTHIETGSNNVSIVLKNATQIERMTITATSGVATIVKRGLTQADTKVENVSYQKQWNDGTIGYVTAFASDLLDIDTSGTRQVITNDLGILTGKKLYLGDNAYVTTSNNGTDLKFKDGSNAEVSLSTLNAGAGTDHKVLTSNLDTTAGYLTEKLTAGDGLNKTIINPGANEILDLDIDLTDTTIFSDVGVASKAVKTDSNGNLFQATETQRGGVERATDAEANTGTDTTRYITPKQARDNYGNAYTLYNGTYYGTNNVAYNSGNLGGIPNSYINASSYATAKTITATEGGRFYIEANIQDDTGNFTAQSIRMYKNGILIQQIDTPYYGSGSYTAVFSNQETKKGDVYRFDVKIIQAQYPVNNELVVVNYIKFLYDTIVNKTLFT